jgi:leucyl-tRNA synthetase
MSKSKGNTIAPDVMIKKYGADTLRLYILSVAPPEDALEWSEEGFNGSRRFVNRVWRLVDRYVTREGATASGSGDTLRPKVHQTIQKVGQDIEQRMRLNTAVAALHELLNEIEGAEATAPAAVLEEAIETIDLLLKALTAQV